jgi:GNAT superfamily N-acetyltransferase
VTPLDARGLLAHADAWQAEGRLREPLGGGVHEDAGARLAASGLPYARWNSGAVVDAARFDLGAARDWYAARAFGAGVPWGMRVPAGAPFPFGRRLLTLACMTLVPAAFVRPAVPPDVRFSAASSADACAVAAIDAAAFDAALDECEQWNTPHLGVAGFDVVLAYVDGEPGPVGTATAVLTRDRAGPCATLFGVGVLAHARGHGIGAAMTAWLIGRAFAAGVTLVHLNPNTETAARLYASLGFVATQGIDVYVDL